MDNISVSAPFHAECLMLFKGRSCPNRIWKPFKTLSQPDTVLEWISLTPAMADSISPLESIALSRGHKYSISYTQTLYLLGISDSNAKGTIPSGPRLSEVCNHFPAPMNIPSLSSSLKRWFLEYEPNEATLVHVLCERLLPLSSSGLDEQDVSILYEFSGPFKTHDLYELAKGEEGIKYPMIKRFPLEEASEILQTPAESDLRSRSDSVFAASPKWFRAAIRASMKVHGKLSHPPCFSNNLRSCAVALVAEVKATASKASFAAAKNQWSSLAYVQLMERVSITREKPYVGDEDIYQYGDGICGLEIMIWNMSLMWNSSEGRDSEILENYFTFPVQTVTVFDLEFQEHLENFIVLHKELLRW